MTRPRAASFSSLYRPRSPGVMRPAASTAVASKIRSDAPEFDSMPRCIMCQSVALPFSALYWHMGETTIRLAKVRPASSIGENSLLGMGCGSRCRDDRDDDASVTEPDRDRLRAASYSAYSAAARP